MPVLYKARRTAMIGHFRLSQGGDEVKQCASIVLSQISYYEQFRVSKSSGCCEPLTASFDKEVNETGYVYAEQFTRLIQFQPPIAMEQKYTIYSSFGYFTPGKRIDLYFTFPTIRWNSISIAFFQNYQFDDTIRLYISFDRRNKRMELVERSIPAKRGVYYYDNNFPGAKSEISFVAKEHNIIQVLLNGKLTATQEGVEAIFASFRNIYISGDFDTSDPTKFQIHGVRVING